MPVDYQQVEHARKLLAQTRKRGYEIISQAGSCEQWPANCDRKVCLFAFELAGFAVSLTDAGALALAIDRDSLEEPIPIEDFDAQWADFDGNSQESDLAPEEAATVALALARRLAASAVDLLQHAEACLAGRETVDGQPIPRSPMHDK